MPILDAIDAGKKWPRGRHLLPILAVASIGFIVAVAAWLVVSIWEARLARATFANVAGDYAAVLQNGLDRNLAEMAVIRAFYDSSIEVDQHEFDVFTRRIMNGQTSMMRLTWSPRIPRADLAAFEKAASAAGLNGYKVRDWALVGELPQVGDRPEYFPVLFMSKVPNSLSVLGVDLGSESARRDAIERAIDGDRIATAPNIELRHSGEGDWHGFFAAAPVYRRGVPNDTPQQRRANTQGILSGTFQTSAVIDSILLASALPDDVNLYLFAEDARPDAAPTVMRGPRSGADLRKATQAELARLPYWSGELKAGDARWTLVITPQDDSLTSFHRTWIVVAFIVLMFGAVIAYMWASARYAMRLEDANSKVLELAQTDLLTSLANRRAFLRRLTKAFAASRRRGAPGFAVLYLDIDDFKDVNDMLGHPMGDSLLKEIVERLRQAVSEEDFVARFGGDEFAILQPNATDSNSVAELATRIAALMAAPFGIGSHQVRITSSIGISMFSPELSGPEAMLMQADLALYRAKDDGRNCYRFHSRGLDQELHERVRVTDELRVALDKSELELYYQPQVELATGRIIGLEALLRWNHPTRGMLSPGYFIPMAERTGAVLLLGRFALEEACRQLKLWQAEGLDPALVGVNVSGVQLKGGAELIRDVEGALSRWNIAPGSIELELTESVLMEATQKHSETLRHLRKLGTKIAIDDFGTGYSSLKYLTIYPLNRLKIAQELVFGVTVNYRNGAVVRAAIRLAQELGIDVIAEGVETAEQADFLIEAGCLQAQGFYYSKPVNAARATELLRQGRIVPTNTAATSILRSSAA